MPQLPFSFSLTGTDDYGTPFASANDAFGSNAVANAVLASILAASQTPGVYGLGIPSTSRAYRVTALADVKSSDATADLTFGVWNGSAFVALFTIVLGAVDRVDFEGIVIPAGYIPALHYEGSGTPSVTGIIEWKD